MKGKGFAFLRDALAGMVIGVANIIPGVSGGTMMVILNVFNKIVNAIGNFRKNSKENLLFLVPLLLGAGVGILAFSKGITFMLEEYPIVTNFFFMGLIIGSIPLVWRSAFPKREAGNVFSVRPFSVVAFAAMFAMLLVFAFLSVEETTLDVHTVSIRFGLLLRLFFGGMIAAVAMIIPGVSGSFVMVLFGIYPIVVGALSVLLPFEMNTFLGLVLPIGASAGLGILLGLLFGAKLIDLLLKRFPQETYCGILGLLLGSLFSIYPGFSFDGQGIGAIFAGLFGLALAYFSSSEWLKNKFVKNRK